MNKIFFPMIFLFITIGIVHANQNYDPVLEPWTYSQNFETVELSAWASYPLWQDAAYDEKIRVNKMVPGDDNISLEQKVIPYSNVDNYAGAQKLVDMYLIPDSNISLRFYLKTQLNVEFIKVRLAAGKMGAVDYTLLTPPTNRWESVEVGYHDFIEQNPSLANGRIKVNALAVLAKFPDADPAMPIYFGLDDIVFKGARATHFKFNEPHMFKLSEWKPYIPNIHYNKGDAFKLSGSWNLEAERVNVIFTPLTDKLKIIHEQNLTKKGDSWSLDGLILSFDEGLYHGTLTAYRGEKILSETEFTFYIAPQRIGDAHPRLWFDAEGEKDVKKRLNSVKFKAVKEQILEDAKKARDEHPVESIIYDIDQFHDEIWLPTLSGYFRRLAYWGEGVYHNALAYRLLGDRDAGQYAKELMVKVSQFPSWLHPWMRKRGRHIYYPVGEMGMEIAVGYDLCYDLLNEQEKSIIRQGLKEKIIEAAHKGYVEDNLVTCSSSNWIAHIIGGSLMSQAVMYGEDHDFGIMEPYFTGAVLKDFALIQNAFGDDGGYGEGLGYYNFTMKSFSKSLPALENVYKVDLSQRIDKSFIELIWAGNIKQKKVFYFGDSGGSLSPLTNWAWLLPKYKDPLLGWFYNYMKDGETLMDVLYETEATPKQDPFEMNPTRVFRDIGTTVFKSGWDVDDFTFVMRTGPFINHQHLDQGSFWLQDNGKTFIEERHGSSYYRQLTYQSHYIQPIAHSTILLDKNPQSQRTGDHQGFAEGFEDYAYMTHFLNGANTAFSSGEIGRLYWGKVKQLTRNVLYLKPRTIIMFDEIVPSDSDVEVSLLYQTHHLRDIVAGSEFSTITKDNNLLYIYHIAPERANAQAEEIIHFYGTLLNQNPLIREGYVSVTAKTAGQPMTMTNILVSSKGNPPQIDIKDYDNYYKGTVEGASVAFGKTQNMVYKTDGITTDALVLNWDKERLFAAKCTKLVENEKLIIESNMPFTCEISDNVINYFLYQKSKVKIGVNKKPAEVFVNDKSIEYSYNDKNQTIELNLQIGEGVVEVQY